VLLSQRDWMSVLQIAARCKSVYALIYSNHMAYGRTSVLSQELRWALTAPYSAVVTNIEAALACFVFALASPIDLTPWTSFLGCFTLLLYFEPFKVMSQSRWCDWHV
jgi:hypothetical protein